MKGLSPTKPQQTDLFDLQKWKAGQKRFIANSGLRYYGNASIAYQGRLLDVLTADSKDAICVREFVRANSLRGEYSSPYEWWLPLQLLFKLLAETMSDLDSSWEMKPVRERREHILAIKNATKALADLLNSTYAPPVPPLWYFLEDQEAASLLRVIDKSQNRGSSTSADALIRDIKLAYERPEDDLATNVVSGQFGSRKRELASLLYVHVSLPMDWLPQYQDCVFLSASTRALVSRLGDYHEQLPIKDVRTNRKGEQVVRIFTKALFNSVVRIYQPAENPFTFVAACVNIAFAAKGGTSITEVSDLNVKKWHTTK